MAAKLGKRSRQRSKMYYGNKKQRVGGLEQLRVGMQGVLITTSDQEKLCVSEAYSLLNEYGDQLYGPEDLHTSEREEGNSDEESNGEDDIEAAMAKEIERLKGKDKDGRPQRRFQAVDTGARHVVFIRCLEEVDPCQLVHHMLSDISSSGVKKSRFCQRVLPITKVCRATVSDLQKQAPPILEPHFHTDSLTVHKFAVNYKARNNHDINRDDIIKCIAAMVTRNGDYEHQVDLNNPDLTVVVEIIKSLCCLSVIKDFTKLKKYNLQSIADPEPQKTEKSVTSKSVTTETNTAAKDERSDLTNSQSGASSGCADNTLLQTEETPAVKNAQDNC